MEACQAGGLDELKPAVSQDEWENLELGTSEDGDFDHIFNCDVDLLVISGRQEDLFRLKCHLGPKWPI